MEDNEVEEMMPRRRHIILDAVINIIYFLGYVIFFHCVGMLVKLVLIGSPWDPWSGLWTWFLDLVGEDKYTLWVYGTVVVTTIHYWLSAAISVYRHHWTPCLAS